MALDTTLDYSIWDGVEAVILTQVASAGDVDQDITTALRRPMTTKELQASYGVYTAGDIHWLLPVDLVEGNIKPRDRITDDFGNVWTVLEVAPMLALGSHWRTTCRNLVIVNDLKDTITIEVPTVTRSATGAIVRTWATKYNAIAGRAQIQETEAFDKRGKKSTVISYKIWVGQQIDPRNTAGDWGRVIVNGAAPIEIRDFKDAEKLTDLPMIEAEGEA